MTQTIRSHTNVCRLFAASSRYATLATESDDLDLALASLRRLCCRFGSQCAVSAIAIGDASPSAADFDWAGGGECPSSARLSETWFCRLSGSECGADTQVVADPASSSASGTRQAARARAQRPADWCAEANAEHSRDSAHAAPASDFAEQSSAESVELACCESPATVSVWSASPLLGCVSSKRDLSLLRSNNSWAETMRRVLLAMK